MSNQLKRKRISKKQQEKVRVAIPKSQTSVVSWMLCRVSIFDLVAAGGALIP